MYISQCLNKRIKKTIFDTKKEGGRDEEYIEE